MIKMIIMMMPTSVHSPKSCYSFYYFMEYMEDLITQGLIVQHKTRYTINRLFFR